MKKQELSKKRRPFLTALDTSKNIELSPPLRGDGSVLVSSKGGSDERNVKAKMRRPVLDEVPVEKVRREFLGGPEARGGKGIVVITMSPGQWDGLLSGAYDGGHILLEVNEHEVPIRAYRRRVAG